MTPTIIHRYAIPVRDAIEALLGDAIGHCERWHLRVEGDEIVIDVVEPAARSPIQETIPEVAVVEPAKPERKGGALAQRDGIMSNERGFWTFAGVASSDQAADFIRGECGIASRADLDHERAAAAKFDGIDKRYRLWLEGYD